MIITLDFTKGDDSFCRVIVKGRLLTNLPIAIFFVARPCHEGLCDFRSMYCVVVSHGCVDLAAFLRY